ncbi:MAG: membrane protein insertase YidC [Bacteroidales bacterium]|nr:membrane protein insertase YidC [Bacteroidales bacterium]
MKKNDIIAFVLIALLLAGSTVFPIIQKKIKDKKALKAVAEQVAETADEQQINDSTTLVIEAPVAETPAQEPAVEETPAQEPIAAEPQKYYKDSSLNIARERAASLCKLENDKLEVVFNTKGAQPYTVRVKDFTPYKSKKDTTVTPDSTSLRLVKEGMSYMDIAVYAGEMVNTAELGFELVPEETNDTTVTMRVMFDNGGYIQQKYTLAPGSYLLKDDLSFVGLADVIPFKVSNINFDWAMIVPRLEKGYKNEKQYSNLSYYYEGEKKPEMLTPRRNNVTSKNIPAKVRWVDFKQQFFSSIVNAPEDFLSGEVTVRFATESEYLEKNRLMTCSAKMVNEIRHSNDIHVPYEFYFGPNDYNGLRKLGQKYEKVVPLGGSLVGWISRFIIIPTFHLLHRGIKNYGLIILIMTILLKIVISPLTYKSYKSSAMTQVLKPEIDKLNEKYPKQEDAMKKQQAQMELYKKAGVNPMGGCLPMLIQFPILWAMFRFFPASIELRQQPFLWAEDLSAYDSVLNIGNWHLSLFALLMAVTMFFFSKMNSKTMSNDPQMAPMKFMTVWMMPIMMFFICNGLSSALSYYYLLSNIFTMIMNWAIKKWFIDEKKILAKVHAKSSAPSKKSKWQLRLEEAQRQMQAQQKAQRR